MEDPICLSDTEDFSLPDTSLMQTSKDNQDYLIMTIELGDGQQQHIKIHSNDDPQQLAHEFIAAHRLNSDLEQSLATLIKQNLGLLDKRSQPSPFLKSSISNYQSLIKENGREKVFESPSAVNHTPKINRNSVILASKHSRGDIHERLYRLAKKRKPKTENLTTAVSEKSYSYFNTGEILYIKGMAMQHAKLRMAEERNKEIEEKQAKELTFKPVINSSQSRYEEKTEDILINKAKDYLAHKQSLKEKYDKEEIKDCSFRPNASKAKEFNNKIHEELYKEASKRQEKQMELSNMKLYSFEPNADKPKNKSKNENKEQFIERLMNSKKKLEEEMEKLRAMQDIKYDPETGQKLYTPRLLNSSQASRRDGKQIWEYLYDLKDSKKENIKRILEQEESIWQENVNQSKIGQHSLKVFENFRLKQYKRLFQVLDSDQDGKISAERIELDEIEPKTLEILSPLLEHLLNSEAEIGLEEFADHLEELRSHLDLHSRSYLIKRDKKIETIEIDPHPKLNPQTLEIAERLKTDESLYERQTKSKQISQLKFKKRKELEQDMLIKNCSFKPKLINNGKIKR